MINREAFDKENGIVDRVSEDKVIDSYYFHIGNSGIIIETNEHYSNHKELENPDADNSFKNWWLTHKLRSHGVGTETTLPLENVEQIDVYIDMLQKVRKKMIEHWGEVGRSRYGSLEEAEPSIIDGCELEEVYTEEEVTEYSRGKDLLGYNMIDKDGKVVGFIENKVEGRGCYECSCSDSEDSIEDECDDTVKDAKDERNL